MSPPVKSVQAQAVLDFGDDEIFVIAMRTEDAFSRESLAAIRRLSTAINGAEPPRTQRNPPTPGPG